MRRIVITFIAAAAAPASAEVQSVDAAGFALENRATVPVPPAEAWAGLVAIDDWWNPAHSYSGDAANLILEPRAGGCFCERIPQDGGWVEHMRVVHVRPGQTLRLAGGLGPLQGEGVAGSLTWTLRPVPGGTEILQAYVVGGHVGGGAEAFAAPVDRVLAEQLSRLAAALSR